LKHPERPAPLQSAGHRWVHSYRGLMWFESLIHCGQKCVQTLLKKAFSTQPSAFSQTDAATGRMNAYECVQVVP
jgi:hypothetical protein